MKDKEVYICECHSNEHQVIFWHDEDDDQLTIEPHLITYRSFFKRLWFGIKYIVGFRNKWSAWDSMMFKPEDLKKLRAYLETKSE